MPPIRHEVNVLSSWKEIAAYLGKGVRTVQRWEQQFGLPVSRPKKAAKGVVLASPESLDRWLATQWATNQSKESLYLGRANGLAASIRDFRRLRQANHELSHDFSKAMEGLRGESEELVRNLSHSSEEKRVVPEKPRHLADGKRSRK